MVEIAICLAIVAFAMVAIMGVLPAGMQVQKENREDTIINYEGAYFIEAIRSGSLGLMDLPNYVEWVMVSNRNTPSPPFYSNLQPHQIIGLLSTPKYIYDVDRKEWITNTVRAKVRAMGGSVADKVPASAESVTQISARANAIRDLSFNYLLTSELVPFRLGPGELSSTNGMSTNDFAALSNRVQLARQMMGNTFELRLTLRWPVRPRDVAGNKSQTFRALLNGNYSIMHANLSNQSCNFYYFTNSTFQRVSQ
jgi:hypothetical protein